MTRTRLSVAERRHTLIDVASPLFASSSYSEVSTQDIAQAAGVSVGLIFHHFGSKAGLYAAVVAQREEELTAAVAEAVEGLPPNTSTRDKVRAAAEVYLDHVAAHPLAWAAVVRGDTPQEVQFVRIEGRDKGVDKLRALVGADGERAAVAVSGFFGFVEVVCLDWADAGCPEDARQPIIDAALGALEGALGDWG